MLIPITSVTVQDDSPLRERAADNRQQRQGPVPSAVPNAPVTTSPPIGRPGPQIQMLLAPLIVMVLLAGFFMVISLTLILTGPRVEGGDQLRGSWDGSFITAPNRDAVR